MMPGGRDTPQYQTLFKNQADLADALSEQNGIAFRLSNKLFEMGVIGKSIRDHAQIRAPGVTEIMRINPIIVALLSSIELNPGKYRDFRTALLASAVDVPQRIVDKYMPALD